jgi:hypothetical protein
MITMADEWVPVDREVGAVSTRVEKEAGRWVVYLDVVLDSGAVSHRVGDYPDEVHAQRAAEIVARNSGRRIDPPTGF